MGCCGSKPQEKKHGGLGLNTSENKLNNPPPEETLPPELPAEPVQGDIKVYIALYDYDARTDEDLSFNKGDYLEVKAENCQFDWWTATSRSTGKTGYIPNNYVAEVKSLEAEE